MSASRGGGWPEAEWRPGEVTEEEARLRGIPTKEEAWSAFWKVVAEAEAAIAIREASEKTE